MPIAEFAATLDLPVNPRAIHTVFAHLPPFPSFTPILESFCRPENRIASELFFDLNGCSRPLLVKELSGVCCRKL